MGDQGSNEQKVRDINEALNSALEHHQAGDVRQAEAMYKEILKTHPKNIDAMHFLGILYYQLGNYNDAIEYLEQALRLDPNDGSAWYNLGLAFKEKGQPDDAITCYQKALELKPDFADACSNLVRQLQHACMWQELESMAAKLDGLTEMALDTGNKPAESPYLSITRHADPSLNSAVAKAWSDDIARAVAHLKINFSPGERRTAKTKITVGYLSGDFRDHATAHLMLSMFKLHNRDDFEIFCYSYGKDDGSYYRGRIQHDCDKFLDISGFSHDAAARRILDDRVDILIDLKGYTEGTRLSICAHRPAPVQVSYLGFPGTTGADFLDYIITDRIVTPEDHTPYYSENIVYMPHSYQGKRPDILRYVNE